MFGFHKRGRDCISADAIPLPEQREMRLLEVQDRVCRAHDVIRAYLHAQSELWPEDRNGEAADVLFEVMVALGLAPAADDVPVIPGRTP